MFKRLLFLLFTIIVLTACNKSYEAAMKSTDKDLILQTANQLFDKGNWQFAIDLYERCSPAFAGTKQGTIIAYKTARANFEDKNYKLAAYQFKNFYVANPTDSLAEEALYKSAFAYYTDSPKYNLDQTSTKSAMNELQGFINTYPNSEYVNQANAYIDELRDKLEKKSFEIAKIYYKTLKYKAAAIAFDNMLDDFPDTKYREEAMMYSLRSKYELAVNFTRFEKKELRLLNTKTQYKIFTKTFPNSKFLDEAQRIMKEVEKDEEKHKELAHKIDLAKENNRNN